MNKQSKTAVFTIVSLNYGAFAKTLMESLFETHPDWDRHVLIVDRLSPPYDQPEAVGGALFETTLIEQLPLPKMNEFLFRYGIMELNTAAKPYMFAELRRRGYEHIVYIDPDILVLDRLTDVEQLLNDGAAAVVTPHLTAPLQDQRLPSELDIMRAGAYNLGFLALGNQTESDAFIRWWEEKLEHGAVSDPAKGLFTDQKWVDLAPGMFGKFAILRDAGYNVAYWNLPHRPVTHENGKWFADSRPLRFFHFSGFDPLNPKPFSKHQDRLTLETIGAAKELALIYGEKVKHHGLSEFRKRSYAFGALNDGTPIPNALRVLYREDADVRFQAGENPFENSAYFIHGEAGDLPVILRAVWLEHTHLQRAFPDPLGSHRFAYYHWFAEAGAVEIGIPEKYVLPMRHLLRKLQEDAKIAQKREPLLSELPNYRPSVWARGLVFMHKRVTGGHIGHARLTQYQQVTHLGGFLKLGFAQFRASRYAHRFGLGSSNRNQPDPLRVSLPYNTHAAHSALTSNRRHAQKMSGIYIEEQQDDWWLGKSARIIVASKAESDTKTVRLQGKFFSEMFAQAYGKNEIELSIGFNDFKRQTMRIVHGHFDQTLELKEFPEEWPAILHITPSETVIPKDLGINDDTRQLSLQISEISVAETSVFCPRTYLARPDLDLCNTPGVNVIGYARSEHGVGQSLRQFVGAISKISIPHVVLDFNKNNHSRTQDHSLDDKIVDDLVHDINVFHINADQMPEVEMQLPTHYFARYNIGFWHWELPNMLPEHLAGLSNLNEVWVPTAFVQDAVSKQSPIPVVRMPHAIYFEVSPNANRQQFNLPENTFLFLMMYDFSSYQERKNPQATLAAFQRAFPQVSDRVALVIKTQNAQHHPEDVKALQAQLAQRKDIIWINETISRQAVYDLQSVCDALVSLHRAEGYGLGPAEAMFLGKPVIATNWSGNTEFMRQDNSLLVNYRLVKIEKDIGVYRAGQTWAEASVEHAADLMLKLVEQPELAISIGAAAYQTMREEFSREVIAKRIQQRLLFIKNEIMAKSSI